MKFYRLALAKGKILYFLALATFHITISIQIVAKALTLFIRIRWLKPNGKDFLFYVFADSIVSAIAMYIIYLSF